MSKHSIGDVVGHSTRGNGVIIGERVETRQNPPFDPIVLRREQLTLQARLAQIEELFARSDKPYEVDVYMVEFAASGKKIEFDGSSIDKLKTRIAE